MDWINIIQKSILGGFAAVGFAILFNVPLRTLVLIFLLGMSGVFIKFFALGCELNIIMASFAGSVLAGTASQFAARVKKTPPLIFSIPSVIPMVPGIFTYKMMIGFVKLTRDMAPGEFDLVLQQTVGNGIKATFIIMVLAIGVGMPNLIMRKESFHDVRFSMKKR